MNGRKSIWSTALDVKNLRSECEWNVIELLDQFVKFLVMK